MILAISLDAESDGLTQLFNHKGFHRRLVEESRRLNRYKRPFSLVYIDLDNFKSVNDQLGHTTGDRLLETVARTIKANTRPTDHSARLGGDEFAILMTETDESQVVTPVEKLFKELITEMNNHDWPVTFSVGVLTWKEDVSNINDIISEADTVMYRVKRTTKNSIAFQTHIAGNPLVEVAAVDTRSVVKP